MQNISSNSIVGHEHDPALDALDITMRIVNLLSQLLYFGVVVFLKDLQCLPQIPMHHTNAIGLINAVHYCFWIMADEPKFSRQFLNDVLCTMSETLWAITKYARAYSILTVALFRYIGVTRLTLYKKITTLNTIVFSIALNWLIAAIVFLVSKYIFKTTYGIIYCYDGYSVNREHNLQYFLLSYSFGYALPLVLVTILYLLIQIKLVKLSKNLENLEKYSRIKMSSLEADESTCHREIKKEEHKARVKIHNREKRLAHQFIIINGLEFCSMFFFTILSLNNLFPILNFNFYYLRQSLRIVNLLLQSAIPITSLLFHPHQNLKIEFRFNSIKVLFCNKTVYL